MTERSEVCEFIICLRCSCMSFNQEDVARLYCGVCQKSHESKADYLVADATESQLEIFREFLATLPQAMKEDKVVMPNDTTPPPEAPKSLDQELLAQFKLYPGMTLKEAARGYIADNRKNMDPAVLLFIAACAIEADDDPLAAIILGLENREGPTGLGSDP